MFFFMMNFTHNRTIYREETSQELFPRNFKNEKRLSSTRYPLNYKEKNSKEEN